MASAITHALVGAALAGVAPRALARARFAVALALLAALPDLDVIGYRLGVPYGHPFGHRGASHSLAFALVVGIAAALVMPRSTARLRAATAFLAMLATASHGLLDALTDAGLGIGFFIPFDDGRYFFPWRPLPTSPLSPGAFFTRRGVEILEAEILLVWIPTLLIAASLALIRRRSRP
jgi:inner membrane protein